MAATAPHHSAAPVALGALLRAAFQRLQRRRLRRSLVRLILIGLGYTLAGSLAVAALHGSGQAAIALGALLWWLLISLFFAVGAALLRRPDGSDIDYYGVPNALTAIRAWSCYPLLLATSLHLPHSLGFIIWCTGGAVTGMLDFVDGFWARRWGPLTELGRAIDPAMDALFFAMAAIASYQTGIVPAWLMALIIFRYAAPLLATPLVFALGARPRLGHTQWGRRNTALVGVVVFTLMWFRIFSGPVDVAALLLAVPLLVPTTLLHFAQLVSRLRAAA